MNAAEPASVRSPQAAGPWLLSVVVPVRAGGPGPDEVADRLRHLPGGSPHEIILVDNGADDDVRARMERLGRTWAHRTTDLVVVGSDPGLGSAYRAGVAVSRGDRVLLTRADLPFGTSDLQAVLACRTLPRLAIGSSAHPRSRVHRTVPRQASATALRRARKALLGLDVGDPEGTFVLEGSLARRLVARTTLTGPGMTTELIALAARFGTAAVELPVARPRTRSSRREAARTIRSAFDLLRVRRLMGPTRVVTLPERPGPVGTGPGRRSAGQSR